MRLAGKVALITGGASGMGESEAMRRLSRITASPSERPSSQSPNPKMRWSQRASFRRVSTASPVRRPDFRGLRGDEPDHRTDGGDLLYSVPALEMPSSKT